MGAELCPPPKKVPHPPLIPVDSGHSRESLNRNWRGGRPFCKPSRTRATVAVETWQNKGQARNMLFGKCQGQVQKYIEWTPCKLYIPNAQKTSPLHQFLYNLSKLREDYISGILVMVSPKGGVVLCWLWKRHLQLQKSMECLRNKPATLNSLGNFIWPDPLPARHWKQDKIPPMLTASHSSLQRQILNDRKADMTQFPGEAAKL